MERHVWLIALLDWIRGHNDGADAAVGRVELLLDVLDARPATTEKLQVWWRALLHTVDGSTLLSDLASVGRDARDDTGAFASETAGRAFMAMAGHMDRTKKR